MPTLTLSLVRRFICMIFSYNLLDYVIQTSADQFHHHHHHVTLSTPISLTRSRHSFLSFIASWLVLRATSRTGTKLLKVGSSWSSCLYTSMWKGPLEYITYELVPTSPTVSCMSDSSNLDSFRDGWKEVMQQLHCEVLSPGPVQYCLQHSCVIGVKLFLHT